MRINERAMPDATMALIIGALFAIVVVVSFALWQHRTPHSSSRRKSTIAERLRAFADESNDYRFYIGIPPSSPTLWITVAKATDESFIVDGYDPISLSEITAFIVTYPNGQIVDCNLRNLLLPEGITGLSPSAEADHDILALTDLQGAEEYIQVTYGRCPSRPNDPEHYSTTLRNISDEKIRINRFAGYVETSRGWELYTVTNQFYSAEEFQQWYGMRDEWIVPGQPVTDLNNYGGLPVLWAYYCECESGKQFIAGAVLQKPTAAK